MTFQVRTPDAWLTDDERQLLAAAEHLGVPDGSVPLLTIAEHLGWSPARARAAADLLVDRHDVRVDSACGAPDEEVELDS